MTTNHLKYYDFSVNGKLSDIQTNATPSTLAFTPFYSNEQTQHKPPLKESLTGATKIDDRLPSNDVLITTQNNLQNDKDSSIYSSKVANPNGYGYVPSLPETRSKDEIDILNQEMSIMAIGSVAGVSLIIFGMIIMYPSTPATSS